MIDLKEFLKGKPLEYRGFNRRKKLFATFVGTGIKISDPKGNEIGTTDGDDMGARRFYAQVQREHIRDKAKW